jgi:DNA-binding CsgD family transcriptional regulator
MPASEIIGRDRELDEVEAFLDAAFHGPAALVLSGEPGIGKTLLWEAGVERARRLGHRVLTHRSVEAEAGFAFAGLADLVGPVFAEVADALPRPRRRALEVALLLAEAGDAPPEPHAIGLALLDVLAALARDGAVVLALDDVQWLDASSASVIPAALRRLRNERAGLLATARGDPPPWFRGVSDLRSLPLRPLDLAATHRLLHDRLGIELSRPQLARVHAISGGNPFFALEVGRTAGASGEPLRVPRSLAELLGVRFDGLPDEVTDMLLAIAAMARPTLETVIAIHADERAAIDALEVATAAELIELDQERIRFAHPLLASLCYERAPVWRRRALHRRIAAAVGDVEERARHLALSAEGPDGVIAAQLDAAAAQAAARGAVAAAAELAELATALTPQGERDAEHRRRVTAATFHSLAGDIDRAISMQEELLAELPPGVLRADVLHIHMMASRKDIPARVRLGEQALREAGADDARAVEYLAQLAVLRWLAGDLGSALEAARDGLERARRLGDARLLAIAQARLGFTENFALHRTPGLVEQAVEIERSLVEPIPFYKSPTFMLAGSLLDSDEPEKTIELLEPFVAAARESGTEHTLGFGFFLISVAERRVGHWQRARAHAAAALEFAEHVHDPDYHALVRWVSAFMDADTGATGRAREVARTGLDYAQAMRDEVCTLASLAALGHIELVGGDHAAAAAHLRGLPARLLRSDPRGRASCAWPDTVEALIAIGDLREAGHRLQEFEAVAARADRLMRIGAARCRGLLAAGRGDTVAALDAFADSLSHDDPSLYPFERARTLLALGAAQRTALQRRAARETLEQARAIFEQLGARPWVEKVRDELQRVSGRGPASSELTEGERRVAELAADGRQNKEIAAALFIGVGTVEAHLSRVYRKLGIRSRTELAARFARHQDEASKV